jgi:hypothetical protein
LAEMVMMAFRKSPADVCVAQECLEERKESRIGIRSWEWSHCTMLVIIGK